MDAIDDDRRVFSLFSLPLSTSTSSPYLSTTHNANSIQPSAFEGEDEEDDDDDDAGPAAPPPQPKKKAEAKTYTKGTTSSKAAAEDEALDDPLAEKLRRQRLVEEADLEMAKELFGTNNSDAGKASVVGSGKAPATAKEADEHGRAVSAMFLAPHASASQYKNLVKAVVKAAMQHLDAPGCKEVEAAAAAVRAEKVKAETAAARAAQGKKSKKTLNVGRSGGAAGLDDYVYDYPLYDDVDFM